jgi:serine O-acetyltransferase
VGENVTIFQGVTLGAKNLDFSYDESLRPSIGDNVIIGAGAKILGGIVVGENSVIGANAVVLHNIPDHTVAYGVPAKWVHSVHNNT